MAVNEDFKEKAKEKLFADEMKRAEAAFRENNMLPEIEKNPTRANYTINQQDIINKAAFFIKAKAEGYTVDEQDIINKALAIIKGNQGERQTYRYNGLEDLEQTVKFEHPTACFLQVVNLDELNSNGWPLVSVYTIKPISLSYQTSNTYSNHGRMIGSEVRNVSFNYKSVLVFIKGGCYSMVSQTVNANSNSGVY